MKVYQMVYQSQAAENLSYSDLNSILAISRDRNLQNGITGILVFRDGHFLHYLEGSREDVQSCYRHICNDRRHHDVRILAETEHIHRAFAGVPLDFLDGDVSNQPHSENIARLFHLAHRLHLADRGLGHARDFEGWDHLDILELCKLLPISSRPASHPLPAAAEHHLH